MKGFTHIQAEEIGIKSSRLVLEISVSPPESRTLVHPPAPRDPAPLFAQPPGQALLHPTNCKLSIFNEGPETKGQGCRKCDHCVSHNLCLPKLPPGLCLACVSPAFPTGLSLPSHLLSLLISINSKTLSSRGLTSPATSLLHPLARHLPEFLLPLPNSAIDFETFRNHPP